MGKQEFIGLAFFYSSTVQDNGDSIIIDNDIEIYFDEFDNAEKVVVTVDSGKKLEKHLSPKKAMSFVESLLS